MYRESPRFSSVLVNVSNPGLEDHQHNALPNLVTCLHLLSSFLKTDIITSHSEVK